VDSEELCKQLKELLSDFERELESDGLSTKVSALIPCFHQLRELGKSMVRMTSGRSARNGILYYFLKYPKTAINGDEPLVVSGIREYARRIRELKVQFGWSIINGLTAKQMAGECKFDQFVSK
jgi:hypothetical protein